MEDPDIRKMYFEAIKWVLGMTEGSTASHPRPKAGADQLLSNAMKGRIFHGMNVWFGIAFERAVGGFVSSRSQSLQHKCQPRAQLKLRAQRKWHASHYPPALVQKGSALFQQDCSFCHGRDAGGGETGPDLTRSKLVTQDVDGDKIGAVVRNGRPDKGMPRFDFSDEEIAGLMAFIHTRKISALTKKGARKGVDVSDLQTGNAEAGKRYFEGVGGCTACHSPTGDLAGIASHYQGLELEEQMLFPNTRNLKSR